MAPGGLPARLDAAATARLLGFAQHDILVSLRAGKLTPLGVLDSFAASEGLRKTAEAARGAARSPNTGGKSGSGVEKGDRPVPLR